LAGACQGRLLTIMAAVKRGYGNGTVGSIAQELFLAFSALYSPKLV
jgi:hypothetical protein